MKDGMRILQLVYRDKQMHGITESGRVGIAIRS